MHVCRYSTPHFSIIIRRFLFRVLQHTRCNAGESGIHDTYLRSFAFFSGGFRQHVFTLYLIFCMSYAHRVERDVAATRRDRASLLLCFREGRTGVRRRDLPSRGRTSARGAAAFFPRWGQCVSRFPSIGPRRTQKWKLDLPDAVPFATRSAIFFSFLLHIAQGFGLVDGSRDDFCRVSSLLRTTSAVSRDCCLNGAESHL